MKSVVDQHSGKRKMIRGKGKKSELPLEVLDNPKNKLECLADNIIKESNEKKDKRDNKKIKKTIKILNGLKSSVRKMPNAQEILFHLKAVETLIHKEK